MKTNLALAFNYREAVSYKSAPISTSTRRKETSSSKEISRLVAAAVVNKGFCDLLLSNPTMAVLQGFHGEEFRLSEDERNLVLSIKAETLSDFAMQLVNQQNEIR